MDNTYKFKPEHKYTEFNKHNSSLYTDNCPFSKYGKSETEKLFS